MSMLSVSEQGGIFVFMLILFCSFASIAGILMGRVVSCMSYFKDDDDEYEEV